MSTWLCGYSPQLASCVAVSRANHQQSLNGIFNTATEATGRLDGRTHLADVHDRRTGRSAGAALPGAGVRRHDAARACTAAASAARRRPRRRRRSRRKKVHTDTVAGSRAQPPTPPTPPVTPSPPAYSGRPARRPARRRQAVTGNQSGPPARARGGGTRPAAA